MTDFSLDNNNQQEITEAQDYSNFEDQNSIELYVF